MHNIRTHLNTTQSVTHESAIILETYHNTVTVTHESVIILETYLNTTQSHKKSANILETSMGRLDFPAEWLRRRCHPSKSLLVRTA